MIRHHGTSIRLLNTKLACVVMVINTPLCSPNTTPFPSFPSPYKQQTKGTSSFGKRHTKTHTGCRRCGRITFHKQKKICSSCGFPQAKIRKCESTRQSARRTISRLLPWLPAPPHRSTDYS